MTPKPLPAAAVAILLLCGAALAVAEDRPTKEDWRIEPWEGQLAMPDGGAFTVRNLHGDVHARRSEVYRADVYAIVQRHADDPRRPEVGLRPMAGGVIAEVVQPGEPGDDGPAEWRYRRVDLTVYVPEGAPWRVVTDAGRIDARRLDSDVEATTATGDITLIMKGGSVEAATRGGAVRVRLGEATWSGERRIESATGDLSVTVPADADLDVVIDTGGEIELDGVPATTAQARGREMSDPAPVRFRLGAGGRTLYLRSHTGNAQFHTAR